MIDTFDQVSAFAIIIDSVGNVESIESLCVYRTWKNVESEEFYDPDAEKNV